MRTRFWEDENRMSSTAVQVRDDATPMVYLHSNIGWIPIGNSPDTYEASMEFAEDLAKNYGLVERSQEVAFWMLGVDGDEV